MTHRIMQEMQKLKKCDLLQIKTLNEYTPPQYLPRKNHMPVIKLTKISSILKNLYVCRRISNTPDNAHTDT